MNNNGSEYVLTVVQHTYCSDCALIKNKIAEVYIMSGLPRGEESRHWRMQILSPPWDRDARGNDFPTGFESFDVPALKMEVNGRTTAVTQEPGTISIILAKLKDMLRERSSNDQLAAEVNKLASAAVKTEDLVCPVA